MTVWDLECNMSVQEFTEWAAYTEIQNAKQKEAMKSGKR